VKRVKKSAIPQKLKEYVEQNPHADWKEFKNSCQDGYKEVIKQLKKDQGGICCYCEIDFGSKEIRDDFRVEHFHPKSNSSYDENWDLDWNNLFGCCHGGSDKYVLNETRFIENKRYRHSDTLKSDFVLDDEILNPLEVPMFPAIFEVMANSGEMRVVEADCPQKLKQKAINSLDAKKLNLNSPNLKEWRKATIEKLREDIDSVLSTGIDISVAINIIVTAQLSKDSNGNFPRFFSTARSYFKNDAENYLRGVGYDG